MNNGFNRGEHQRKNDSSQDQDPSQLKNFKFTHDEDADVGLASVGFGFHLSLGESDADLMTEEHIRRKLELNPSTGKDLKMQIKIQPRTLIIIFKY
jgi:hypothetical protein